MKAQLNCARYHVIPEGIPDFIPNFTIFYMVFPITKRRTDNTKCSGRQQVKWQKVDLQVAGDIHTGGISMIIRSKQLSNDELSNIYQ